MYASSPPALSTERRAWVVTLSWIISSSVSLYSFFLCALGFHWRRVLIRSTRRGEARRGGERSGPGGWGVAERRPRVGDRPAEARAREGVGEKKTLTTNEGTHRRGVPSPLASERGRRGVEGRAASRGAPVPAVLRDFVPELRGLSPEQTQPRALLHEPAPLDPRGDAPPGGHDDATRATTRLPPEPRPGPGPEGPPRARFPTALETATTRATRPNERERASGAPRRRVRGSGRRVWKRSLTCSHRGW